MIIFREDKNDTLQYHIQQDTMRMNYGNYEVINQRLPKYNQATKANNTLYISGQIPADAATGEIVTSSIEDPQDVTKNANLYAEKVAESLEKKKK